MRLTIVAAVAANGVIGADGEMPWHYPADLRHFKQLTMGHPVILGRVTYETIADRIGGPLPGRTSVVLTRSPDRVDTSSPRVRVATTVEEAVECARETDASEAFVAGGASVYEQFLPVADRMVLTEVHETHEGDTTFPGWDEENWQELERDERAALSFVTYRRRNGG
jgi:dihydrofolate reductase